MPPDPPLMPPDTPNTPDAGQAIATGQIILPSVISNILNLTSIISVYLNTALGGKGNVVALRGIATTLDNERMDAFNAVLKGSPGTKLLDARYANLNRDDAFKVTQDYLTRFKQIDAIRAVTGLEIASLCADLSTLVPGRALDDDANLLLRFTNGARGVLVASQINTGVENDLRLRVSGTLGSIEWRQEQPSQLLHTALNARRCLLTRGSPWPDAAAQQASRLPAGHPEDFIEAFANVYGGVMADIRARLEGRADDASTSVHPRVQEGARGVRFIERTVASAASQGKWTAR